MNRRIHNVVLTPDCNYWLHMNGRETHVATELYNALEHISPVTRRVEFARRRIANAERITLSLLPARLLPTGSTKREGFQADTIHGAIWMCPDTTRALLGVGQKTKHFSVWVRPVVE